MKRTLWILSLCLLAPAVAGPSPGPVPGNALELPAKAPEAWLPLMRNAWQRCQRARAELASPDPSEERLKEIYGPDGGEVRNRLAQLLGRTGPFVRRPADNASERRAEIGLVFHYLVDVGGCVPEALLAQWRHDDPAVEGALKILADPAQQWKADVLMPAVLTVARALAKSAAQPPPRETWAPLQGGFLPEPELEHLFSLPAMAPAGSRALAQGLTLCQKAEELKLRGAGTTDILGQLGWVPPEDWSEILYHEVDPEAGGGTLNDRMDRLAIAYHLLVDIRGWRTRQLQAHWKAATPGILVYLRQLDAARSRHNDVRSLELVKIVAPTIARSLLWRPIAGERHVVAGNRRLVALLALLSVAFLGASAGVYWSRRRRSEAPAGSLLPDLPARFLRPVSIGRGGMGVVVRATDAILRREVAVKVLPPTPERGPKVVSRFLQEMKVMSALAHPNIIKILGSEELPVPFLIMEYFPAPNLHDLLGNGPLPDVRWLTIAVQIARALEYAHAREIVHRDVKPGNVLVDENNCVKVLDFGLARLTHGARITSTRDTVGTLSYMAPEQMRGQEVTPAIDVYALGLVMLEMATGEPPFGEFDIAARLTVSPPRLSAHPYLGNRLSDIVASAVALSPADRPTCAQLAASLDECCRTLEQVTVQS
jgi:hypothetical protein